jgi:flagellar basal-body rod modification protein FlgD
LELIGEKTMASISGLTFPSVPNANAVQKQKTDDPTGIDLQNIGEGDFLKLLVAQLQNQDPLSPLQNQEFVAQLATFSSLEQLMAINKAITKLADNTQVTTPSV